MTDFENQQQTLGQPLVEEPRIMVRELDVFYGDKQALFDIDLDIASNQVLSLIGPSGCGKSTFLRCLNRMNDTIDTCRVEGSIHLDGEDIYRRGIDPVELRARVGTTLSRNRSTITSLTDLAFMV